MIWGTCSCALSDDCLVALAFFDYPNSASNYPKILLLNVPGLFVGCFAVRSVLRSSLGCFYSEICLEMIQTNIRSDRSTHITPLSQTQTRYLPNSLIKAIVNDLMPENWGEKIEFDVHYKECAPISCTYTAAKRNDVSYIITFVMAVFEGVSIAFQILMSFLVRWIRNRSRQNLGPTST